MKSPSFLSACSLVVIFYMNSSTIAEQPKFLKSNKSFFNLGRKDHLNQKPSNYHRHHRVRRAAQFSADDIQAIVDLHNDLRGQVDPEASNMEYMTWDDDLAAMAQEWSDGCVFEHGNPTNISPFSSVGQNLWIGTGSESSPPAGTGPTQSWYNEDQYYSYDTKTCSNVCGHYTQVVWASTNAVGCGRMFCSTAVIDQDTGDTWNNAWLVTCNYGPAGNYAGASPYTSGSSCTQCDSGVGECYNNLCRSCSDHEEECVCKQSCANCGTLLSNCSCDCQDGWYDADCSTECVDTHQYCWASPGWPGPEYCDFHSAIPVGCPLMCSVCNAADPDFVCVESTATSSQQPSTQSGGNNMQSSSVSAVQSSSVSAVQSSSVSAVQSSSVSAVQSNSVLAPLGQTTTRAPSTEAADNCSPVLTCENGGTFSEADCTCACDDGYQGDTCQHVTDQVRYGVLVLIFADINDWSRIQALLFQIIGRIVTELCNEDEYFSVCCPGSSSKLNQLLLSYVDESHVQLADGYPDESDNENAYYVMLYVSPPGTSDLCTLGGQASRRRRDTEQGYLDQDTLYQSIVDNTAVIENELNITLGTVSKGVPVEPTSSGGFPVWTVIVIVLLLPLFAIMVIIVIVGLIVYIKCIKTPAKVSSEKKPKRTGVTLITVERPHKLSERLSNTTLDRDGTPLPVLPPIKQSSLDLMDA